MVIRQRSFKKKFSVTVTFADGRTEVYENLDAETFIARMFLIIERIMDEQITVRKILVHVKKAPK